MKKATQVRFTCSKSAIEALEKVLQQNISCLHNKRFEATICSRNCYEKSNKTFVKLLFDILFSITKRLAYVCTFQIEQKHSTIDV